MGSWISNLHIRKKDAISIEKVMESLQSILEKQGYKLAASAEAADYGYAVLESV